MARGRIDPPNLDDRTWEVIVAQAHALVPKYAPQWTDLGESDLGITLIELFAWLVEGMIFRLNQVPDRNYVEFLNLLGITRDPASPASTRLTLSLAPLSGPVTVPAGSQFATQQDEKQAGVVFETDDAVVVLPSNLKEAHLARAAGPPPALVTEDVQSRLFGSPLGGQVLDLQSADPPSIQIFLGFDLAVMQPFAIDLHVSEAKAGNPSLSVPANLAWSYSVADESLWKTITVGDGTSGLRQTGRVTFPTPAGWSPQPRSAWSSQVPDSAGRGNSIPLFWLRLQMSAASATQVKIDYVLFNSVSATNALTSKNEEPVYVSDGKAFQFIELRNRPLFSRPASPQPYDHVRVEVREPGAAAPQVWTALTDLPDGPTNAFRLNPVTGTIEFGDDQHGRVPPSGSEVRVVSYRYVAGGASGNVAPASVTVQRTPISGIARVFNPGAAQGGADEEDIDEAKRRAPEVLRNRFRAVTAEDYEFLAQEASTAVKKTRCLTPPNRLDNTGPAPAFGGLVRDHGHVNVIIVPNLTSDDRPRPSTELIRDVQRYLNDHRVVATSATVTGPRYVPVKATVTVKLWPPSSTSPQSRTDDALHTEIEKLVRAYLHPLTGGKNGDGWAVGEPLFVSGLFDRVQALIGSDGFINSLIVEPQAPDYVPPVRPPLGVLGLSDIASAVGVSVADYELICGGSEHAIEINHLQ